MRGERFFAALARNMVLAAALGALFYSVLPRPGGAWWGYFDAFTLAFCFTFLGWVLERLLLLVPGIELGAGRLVRLAAWFGGGLWIYEIGRRVWLAYGRDTADLPGLVWGGVFLVALELAAHAALRLRGKPNFYSGGQAAG